LIVGFANDYNGRGKRNCDCSVKEMVMVVRKPRHSPEEFVRRGTEIFERVVQPAVRPENENQFVAIDIETEQFAFDDDDYTAGDKLLKRVPDAQMWMARVGHPAAYRIGGRWVGRGRQIDTSLRRLVQLMCM
jgi:hypothetical protein